MAGEGQLKEQAKYQWDRLNVEGCKIINEILTATPERKQHSSNRRTNQVSSRLQTYFSTSTTTQREKNTLGSNHQPDWRQMLSMSQQYPVAIGLEGEVSQ